MSEKKINKYSSEEINDELSFNDLKNIAGGVKITEESITKSNNGLIDFGGSGNAGDSNADWDFNDLDTSHRYEQANEDSIASMAPTINAMYGGAVTPSSISIDIGVNYESGMAIDDVPSDVNISESSSDDRNPSDEDYHDRSSTTKTTTIVNSDGTTTVVETTTTTSEGSQTSSGNSDNGDTPADRFINTQGGENSSPGSNSENTTRTTTTRDSTPDERSGSTTTTTTTNEEGGPSANEEISLERGSISFDIEEDIPSNVNINGSSSN